MAKSAYPTQADLESFLTAAGFTVGTLDTSTAIAAGIAEFEARARRKMLAAASASTRYFDPPAGLPRGLLDFEGDLATLTGVVYRPQAGTAEMLVQNTDFVLLEYNIAGAPDATGYWGAEFLRRWSLPLSFSLRRSVEVTGRWGYGTSMPDDAWLAMVARAASLLAPSKGFSLSGGRVRTEDSGVERVYGEDPVAGARRAWERQFEAAVAVYRRL